MSSPDTNLDPVNPPDNTSPEPEVQPSTDPASTDEETTFGLTDPPAPINPPDNT